MDAIASKTMNSSISKPHGSTTMTPSNSLELDETRPTIDDDDEVSRLPNLTSPCKLHLVRLNLNQNMTISRLVFFIGILNMIEIKSEGFYPHICSL